jgi:glycyl-tRNA synthetase beta subunit
VTSTRQYVALDTYEKVKAQLEEQLANAQSELTLTADIVQDLLREIHNLLEWRDVEPHWQLRKYLNEADGAVRRIRKANQERAEIEVTEEALPPPQVTMAVDEVTGSW